MSKKERTMSSNHSVGAMNELADVLDNVGYTPEDVSKLRRGDHLGKILDVLHGRAKIVPIEQEMISTILKINRSKPFNPVEFFGQSWKIAEEDERSLNITELDLDAVRLEDMLKSGEVFIKGEEKLKRLKSHGNIRLDAKIFETLWKNQQLIPKKWKEETDGEATYIFFDGTIFVSPDGVRRVFCLLWDGHGWRWGCRWLGCDRYVNSLSAVLASVGA